MHSRLKAHGGEHALGAGLLKAEVRRFGGEHDEVSR